MLGNIILGLRIRELFEESEYTGNTFYGAAYLYGQFNAG